MTDPVSTSGADAAATRTIVYVSRSAPGLTGDTVAALVFGARAFNAINGISGLLSHDLRGFLQVIEGSSDAIDELLGSIERDPRHSDMQMIADLRLAKRQFMTFNDFICVRDRTASLALLPTSTRSRLAPELVAAIDRGYALLSG